MFLPLVGKSNLSSSRNVRINLCHLQISFDAMWVWLSPLEFLYKANLTSDGHQCDKLQVVSFDASKFERPYRLHAYSMCNVSSFLIYRLFYLFVS